MPVCANCHRAIGSLEKTMIFDGHQVCDDCYEKLNMQHGKSEFLNPERNAAASGRMLRVLLWFAISAVVLILFAWAIGAYR